MTYLEILQWIENHVIAIEGDCNDSIGIEYFDELGNTLESWGKDLISIVLEINNKELIK